MWAKMKKISVIIPCFNRVDTLEETLTALQACDPRPHEVLLIDQSNAPFDEQICCMIEKYKNLYVRYLHLENPSSAHARNVGIDECNGDIIVFMDDDVTVPNDIFAKITEVLIDSDIVMIAGIDLYSRQSTSKLGYLFDMKSVKNRKIGHVTASMLGRFPTAAAMEGGQVETLWAMGFFFVVDKMLIDKYQLRFEERFKKYAYAEDLDFTQQYAKVAKQENRKSVIDMRICVKHRASQEWRSSSKTTTYMYIIHRMYLLYKNEANIGRWIAFWWSVVGMFLFRLLQKDNVKDYIGAVKLAVEHKSAISKGDLLYKYYL